MRIEPRLDIIGAALADPSRSRILCVLMDGRAFTNKELACAAEISPQTASAHLAHLESTGMTASLRSGRHVYHRIANSDVAGVLESIASLSPIDHLARNARTSADTRRARTCYNHIAGRLGVLMTQGLADRDVIRIREETVSPGAQLDAFCAELAIEVPVVSPGRPLMKLCLDWTERRHHLSGPLATAILDVSLGRNWIERRKSSRALTVTPAGLQVFERLFGINSRELETIAPD